MIDNWLLTPSQATAERERVSDGERVMERERERVHGNKAMR